VETGKQPEASEELSTGSPEWAALRGLLEFVRSTEREELSPEVRERIRERVLERLKRDDARRRTARALLTGASTVLLAGLLLTLVGRALRQS
jgi:hypothetical protein